MSETETTPEADTAPETAPEQTYAVLVGLCAAFTPPALFAVPPLQVVLLGSWEECVSAVQSVSTTWVSVVPWTRSRPAGVFSCDTERHQP